MTVEVGLSRGFWSLEFAVSPAATLVLPSATTRMDGLWKTTCFELFVKSRRSDRYREFNFAPHMGWAAFDFTSRRRGMERPALDPEPHLVDIRVGGNRGRYPDNYELYVGLSADQLSADPAKIGLSAVIEERGGHKTYWALRHPPGDPDFHHPDCFALELPPSDDR